MPEAKALVGCKCGRIHTIRGAQTVVTWALEHQNHGGFAFFVTEDDDGNT